MITVKRLAISALLTAASFQTSHAADIFSLLDGIRRDINATVGAILPGIGLGEDLIPPIQALEAEAPQAAPKSTRRYGLRLTGTPAQEITGSLASHPATKRGQDLLESLQSTSRGGSAAATTSTTPSYDIRTYIGNPTGSTSVTAATAISLANSLFPAYDQGQLGSCTANAAGRAIETRYIISQLAGGARSLKAQTPSRLALYWWERKNDTSLNTSEDTGAYISDSIYALIHNGVFPESLWPYTDQTATTVVPSPFTPGTAPFTQTPPTLAAGTPTLVDTDTLVAAQITSTGTALLTAIQNALSANHPVVIGITVYNSFESASATATGTIPMPSAADLRAGPLGGHAVMLVGYTGAATSTSGTFTFANSWGTDWGNSGHGTLPYGYITNSTYTSGIYLLSAISAGTAS